jgi:superoxide dismutase, Cu-Zn family
MGTASGSTTMSKPTGLDGGGNVTGTVDMVEENGTVAINISISGATPGQHGMHIHANGSCEANDAGPAGAAGGHWNPNDAGHGLPSSASHHPGDFGNIEIAAGGTGTLTLSSKDFTIQGTGTTSALNHAVIFHQGTDDGTTQPTGNSGGRAGCGIIQPK